MLGESILGRVGCDVEELFQNISKWKAEECSKPEADEEEDESSVAHKVDQYLNRFYNLRRVFVEHQGEEDLVIMVDEADLGRKSRINKKKKKPFWKPWPKYKSRKRATKEDPDKALETLLTALLDSDSKSVTPCPEEMSSKTRRQIRIYKKQKPLWKRCCLWKPWKKAQQATKQDPDKALESLLTAFLDSDSKSVTPCPEEMSSKTRRQIRIYKKQKPLWKRCCLWKPWKKAQRARKQHSDNAVESVSDTKSVPPCPEKTSATPSIGPSEDSKAANEADLTSFPPKPINLPDKDVQLESSRSRRQNRISRKKKKSFWKRCREWKPWKKVQRARKQDSDKAVESVSDSKSVPPCPEKTSATHSIGSSEDSKAANEADLTSFPPKPINLPDKDVQLESSRSRRQNRISRKKKKSFWKRCREWKPWKKVQRARKQDSDKAVESVSDSKSVPPCPEKTSATHSIGSSEDSKAANEADLTSVPPEPINVPDEDVQLESDRSRRQSRNNKKIDKKRKPFWKHWCEWKPWKKTQRARKRDSDKAVKSVLTDAFLDSDSKSVHPCPEETRSRRQSRINKKEKPFWKCWPKWKPWKKAQPATKQDSDKAVKSVSGSKSASLVITSNILQNLKSSIDKTLRETLGADKSSHMTLKLTEAIGSIVNDSVTSALLEAMQAPQNEGSSNVHRAIYCIQQTKGWWQSNKVHPDSNQQMDKAVMLSSGEQSSSPKCSSSPPQASSRISSRGSNNTPLVLLDYEGEDEEKTLEDTRNTPPSHSILEGDEHANQLSSASQLRSAIQLSSAYQLSSASQLRSATEHSSASELSELSYASELDSQGVMAASDTDANKTQDDEGDCVYPTCKKTKSSQTSAEVQTDKKISIMKRLRRFLHL
ncbi:uncharacterized protein LOC141780764 [Sebastes fasciatus]|uniref:uncharacterized protein LOC141780764 n=1 Tax=Sebastes fasciatus TaxID=394691 RepID=UPI003D9F3976